MIGIGVDLCEVDRMRAALDRTPTLRARVFTDDEQAYCDRRKDPTERYAARFAAKEAVMKAMGVGCRRLQVAGDRGGQGPRPARRRSACTAGAQRLAEGPASRAGASRMTHTHRVAEAIAVAL